MLAEMASSSRDRSRAVSPAISDAVLDAAERVLLQAGWDGLSLERVASAAGLSRATAWRRGVNRDALIDALVNRLGADYQRQMWPVLVALDPVADRLRSAVAALWRVVETHLPLVLASDSVFHRNSSQSVNFTDPFVKLVEEGQANGTLRPEGAARDVAAAIFNTACWPYVHLRGHHHWPADKAERLVGGLLLGGLFAEAPAAAKGQEQDRS